MAYEAMRKKADYLKRGRPLAAVDTDGLKGQWVAAFREWVQDTEVPRNHRERFDIEVELNLRGEDLPAALVVEENRMLEEKIQQKIQQVAKDPALKAELDRIFTRDYHEFLESFQNPH
jgi:hypothetical protein